MSSIRPKSASSVQSNKSSRGNIVGSPSVKGLPVAQMSPTSAAQQQSILESKNNRKRAEADLQLLSNRIALLRLEEQKSLQKVQETKIRAKEILDIKKRNEDAIQFRIMHNVTKEMEVKEIQEKAAAEREARRKKLEITRQNLVESKRQVAVQLKQEQKIHEESAVVMKIQAENVNKDKAAEEKRRREVILQRREEERKVKEQAIQDEVIRKIQVEEQKRLDAERVITALEEEERALIERLKKTQELQEKAIATLQKSLEV